MSFASSFSKFKPGKTYPFHVLILSLGAFFLPSIYTDVLLHKSFLTKHIFVALVSISATVAWLLSIRKPQTKLVQFHPLYTTLIVIFIFSALSIFWSHFQGTYYFEIIHFACLLLLSFTAMQIKNFRQIQFILFSAVAGGAIATLTAFIQSWGWNFFNFHSQGFPAASFINKNYLANYIDLLLPISLFLLVTLNKNHLKWVVSVFISLLFSYLIFSHNRASWLSLIIVFSLVLYFSYTCLWLKNELHLIDSKYIVFIFILSISLINSPEKTINNKSTFKNLYHSLEKTEDTSSASIRLTAYNNATTMIKDSPLFGTGLGSFQIAFKPYDQDVRNKHTTSTFIQLHNDPLQIFVELGIIGGLLVCGFITLILYTSYKYIINFHINKSSDKGLKIIYLGILLSIIASIIHSFLSFPLHLPASTFLLFLYIGLLLSNQTKTHKLAFKFKLPVFIIIIIVSILTIHFYSAFSRSSYKINTAINLLFNYYPKQGYQPIRQKNKKLICDEALSKTKQALNIYSDNFYIQGWAYVIYDQCNEKTEEFSKLSNKILSNNPYHRIALESSALNSYNQNDYVAAKGYYQVLHFLYPFNAGYTLLLGHIAVKQKNYSQAHGFYLKTLSISPNNTVAKETIKTLSNKGYIPTH